MRNAVVLCLLLVVLVPAAYSDDQPPPPPPHGPHPHDLPHQIPLVNGSVTADGLLDEGVWSQALAMHLNFEVRPGENIPPPVDTEVLLAYGESDLYIAFKAYDPDPHAIRARIRDRDRIGSDDWVAINLDTFNDARRSFLLMCNPYGVQSDFIETTGGGGAEWNPIWDSGGRIHDWGYAVEMVVPFSSLRFQRSAEDQIWGVDAIRSYPRNVRHHIGLFPRDRDNNCYLCQATKIVGFAGADPGRNLEIDPTISGFLSQERESSDYGPFVDGTKELDAGFTARWGVTPNLTLATTANPDFSQVEADAFQLDVNRRFALYYSEQRPFFLEGSEIFDSHEDLVYTRTVADPYWGAKLTGKEGANGIGVFIAQDNVTNLLMPSQDGSDSKQLSRDSYVGVFRYKRDLGESSYLGATVTDREAEGYGNRVGSLDATIDITQNNRFRLQSMGSWTEYPPNIQRNFDQDDELFGESTYMQFIHSRRTWDTWVYGIRRHADFRADAGFVSRTDMAVYGGGYEYDYYNPKPDDWWTLAVFGMEIEEDRSYDLNQTLEQEVNGWLYAEGAKQSWLNFFGEMRREWFEGKEYIGDSMWLGSGFFPNENVYAEMGFGWGKEIDYENSRPGTEISLNPSVELLLGRHVQLALYHTYNYLDVEPGRLYTANISRVRFVYQFNRRMFVRAIVQNVHYDFNQELYNEPGDVDDVYQRIASQLLFSYTVNPQTVVYIGYSDNIRAYDNAPLTQTDRVFFFKLGYAWVL